MGLIRGVQCCIVDLTGIGLSHVWWFLNIALLLVSLMDEFALLMACVCLCWHDLCVFVYWCVCVCWLRVWRRKGFITLGTKQV